MDGLFDRDVFLKLCCCNLWWESIEALGITNAYRLEATSSARSNRKKIFQMLREVDLSEAILRTQEIVDVVPVLSDDMVNDIYASEGFNELAGIDDIDGGEQILAAILINSPDGRVLLSGDKRFVQAFRENLPDRWDTLSEAIISFEMCLLAVEAHYGFDFVFERVHPVRRIDGSLNLALGENPTSATFRDALDSFNPCREVIPIAE